VKPVTAVPQNSLSQLVDQAQKLKAAVAPVASTAAATLSAAKASYDAAQAGNSGMELTAYDAWGSRESASVYSACMATRSAAAMDSITTGLDAIPRIG
jgi:hypothetical protein